MRCIQVNTKSPYRVLVGSGLLQQAGQHIRQAVGGQKIMIVSDSNVFPLYGEVLSSQLTGAGFACCSFVFPAGEESKNGSTYLQLLGALAQNQLTRTDCIVALGGGVVGDLAGFAAATYLRGIDYIQVPTTVLACVDSSVGGKTAIDLDAGKNLAGAFYQPRLVLCDIDTLSSLPKDIFRDGCAEVIKYGVLYDEALFHELSRSAAAFDRETVISRCVELKRDVVVGDEFDRGQRQKLNLGHTFGHGIEAKSAFTVSHGQAVAAGMAIMARACAKKGICSWETAAAIVNVLQRFSLPVRTDYAVEDIYTCALSDKKRSGGTVNLIVPRSIGCCEILSTPVEQMKEFIEAGM